MLTPGVFGGEIVVIGGANVDVKARSFATVTLGTSNPGTATTSAGGVARNIAENLARLGDPVRLISVVGRDALGDSLLDHTSAAGVNIEGMSRIDQPTGTYTATLDSDGELTVAIADMSAMEEFGPEHIHDMAHAIQQAALMVVDSNLRVDTFDTVLSLAVGIPVVVEPVSVPKVSRLKGMIDSRVFAITPSREELSALTGMATDTDDRVQDATQLLHAYGVSVVWVSLGERGSLLSSQGETQWLPAIRGEVIDVTGAGDAMLAGFCHVLMDGGTPVEAARLGHAAAVVTIASPHTVRPDLTLGLLQATLHDSDPV